MDPADVFDASTEELLVELARLKAENALGGGVDNATEFQCQLILTELAERRFSEDLLTHLPPSPSYDTQPRPSLTTSPPFSPQCIPAPQPLPNRIPSNNPLPFTPPPPLTPPSLPTPPPITSPNPEPNQTDHASCQPKSPLPAPPINNSLNISTNTITRLLQPVVIDAPPRLPPHPKRPHHSHPPPSTSSTKLTSTKFLPTSHHPQPKLAPKSTPLVPRLPQSASHSSTPNYGAPKSSPTRKPPSSINHVLSALPPNLDPVFPHPISVRTSPLPLPSPPPPPTPPSRVPPQTHKNTEPEPTKALLGATPAVASLQPPPTNHGTPPVTSPRQRLDSPCHAGDGAELREPESRQVESSEGLSELGSTGDRETAREPITEEFGFTGDSETAREAITEEFGFTGDSETAGQPTREGAEPITPAGLQVCSSLSSCGSCFPSGGVERERDRRDTEEEGVGSLSPAESAKCAESANHAEVEHYAESETVLQQAAVAGSSSPAEPGVLAESAWLPEDVSQPVEPAAGAESARCAESASCPESEILSESASGADSDRASKAQDATAEGSSSSAHFAKFEEIFTAFSPSHLALVAKRRTHHKRTCTPHDHYKAILAKLSEDQVTKSGGASWQRYFKVDTGLHSEVQTLLTKIMSQLDGWAEASSSSPLGWNILWSWSARTGVAMGDLLTWQKVNHYPHSNQLTRKDHLKRHLARFTQLPLDLRKTAATFDIMPTTYTLPREYVPFVTSFSQAAESCNVDEITPTPEVLEESTPAKNIRQSNKALGCLEGGAGACEKEEAHGEKGACGTGVCPGGCVCGSKQDPSQHGASTVGGSEEGPFGNVNFWIMKPVGLSRGRGIFLVNDIGSVVYGERMVVQRYISRPLLVNGCKFDLRLYVLVTSFSPLEAFLYQAGFARFASVPYSTSPEDIDNKYMHLTNTAIQRQQDATNPSSDNSWAPTRLKWPLPQVWAALEGLGIDTTALWALITDLILKSLVAVEGAIPHQDNCFELFGYDVLIDADLRPWLLEVNSSPSLSCEAPLDESVKESLIADTIHLVDPLAFDRKALYEVLQRRVREVESRGSGLSSRHPTPQSTSREKAILSQDLHSILGSRHSRPYGEMPARMGGYTRISPSRAYTNLLRIARPS